MKKKILIGLLVVFVLAQFVKPQKNLGNNRQNDIATKYNVPENIDKILQNACNDCHSNKTSYPWYANIQPIAWWLNHHVSDGKKHLNFSEFTLKPIAVQNHKLEEVIETVEKHEMPLNSYTYFGLHPEAKLNQEQRNQLITWAKTQLDSLKAQYPADSLILKRRKK
jgi:hypothetical protein